MKPLYGAFLACCLAATPAQSDPPAEMEDCTGPGADFCFEGTSAVVDEGCGARFELYQGRIAWPALKNAGPITIAVQTRNFRFGSTPLPLYVEIRSRPSPQDAGACQTFESGLVLLVAQGGSQCGGTWESAGPIDLATYGIAVGSNYNVQCTFFQSFPGYEVHSVGFACIRVTSTTTSVAALSWQAAKRLYK